MYGFPEAFSGSLLIDLSEDSNPVCEIVYLAPRDRQDSFIRILNEYQVIRKNQSKSPRKYLIIESRLMDALSEIGISEENLRNKLNVLNDRKIFRFKNYEII